MVQHYLVPQAAACLDMSKDIHKHPLDRHHYNLQKFTGPTDPEYQTVEDAVVGMAGGAKRYLQDCAIGKLHAVFQRFQAIVHMLFFSMEAENVLTDFRLQKGKVSCAFQPQQELHRAKCATRPIETNAL